MASIVSSENYGFKLVAYVGIGMIMLAFDLDENKAGNPAGFAVKCTPLSDEPFYLQNRINFFE
jgi:hypothetical protein